MGRLAGLLQTHGVLDRHLPFALRIIKQHSSLTRPLDFADHPYVYYMVTRDKLVSFSLL
jgi:hypothetical protein